MKVGDNYCHPGTIRGAMIFVAVRQLFTNESKKFAYCKRDIVPTVPEIILNVQHRLFKTLLLFMEYKYYS